MIKQTKIWKFFSSIKLAIWLLAIIAIFSLIGTFIPQGQEPAEYTSHYGSSAYNLLNITGLTHVYSSWWFILSLALLTLNLSVCLINRFSLKPILLGTMISHFSVLLIFAGALVGMFFGEKGYVQIKEGESISSFISENKKVDLGFTLRLDDFIYEEEISPKEKLLIYSHEDNKLLKEVAVSLGKEISFGEGYKVKIMRFIPDFSMDLTTKEVVSRSSEPRNPAIEIELKDREGNAKTFWVFANFPDMHSVQTDFRFVYQWGMRRPKDFISKVTVLKGAEEVAKKDIKVNFPLKFNGYSFFQSSYDRENLSWSGLQINKDPGVSVVYTGFLLLLLGLSIIFYVNPLVRRKK
ncbi:MAG: cytochrome c biogenesis protein ResB [Candidatus Omnitrophota bacterium]|nr:cytochrome c biogenesis protein ResB [Candidatus Omnitrophota bacterium]